MSVGSPADDSFKKYQRMFRGAVGRGFNTNIFKPLKSSGNAQLVHNNGSIEFSTDTGRTPRRIRDSGMKWHIHRNGSESWTCKSRDGLGNTFMKLRSEDVTPCAMWLALQARLHPGIHLKLSSEPSKKRRGGSVASRTRSKRGRGGRVVSVRRVYNTRSKALSRTVGK